jgi:hypothetical protein
MTKDKTIQHLEATLILPKEAMQDFSYQTALEK